MTPVYQKSATDCLSAAVASVLDRPLESVPVWWDLIGEAWLAAVTEWAEQNGYGICYFDLKDRTAWPSLHNHYVIVSGTTERSKEYLHCVVARAETINGETRLHWVHDPCRGGNFITDPDHCLIFIPGVA